MVRAQDAPDKWELQNIKHFHFGPAVFGQINTCIEFHNFHSKLDEFFDRFIDNMSIDLLAAISLWCDYTTRSTKK